MPPVLHREYCIQDGNLVPSFSLGRARRKFPLYDACSVANVSTGVLDTRVNPETCRTRVDGRIRFQTWKCLNPERKSCGFGNVRVRVAEHKALFTYIRIFLKPVKRCFRPRVNGVLISFRAPKTQVFKNGPRVKILKTLDCRYR